MLIRKTAIRSLKGLRSGLEYVETDWEAKELGEDMPRGIFIDGDPNLVYQTAREIKEGNVGYSLVISFAENEEELKKKLAEKGRDIYDLWEEIKAFLFYGYREGEIAYSVVAHRGDEGKPHKKEHENFHFHIHIANRIVGTDKPLRFWFYQKDLDLLKAWIDRKFGLKSPLPPDHPYMQLPLERIEELLKERLEKRHQYLEEYYKNLKRDGEPYPSPLEVFNLPPPPKPVLRKKEEEQALFLSGQLSTARKRLPRAVEILSRQKKRLPRIFWNEAIRKGEEAKRMRYSAKKLRELIELPELLNYFGILYHSGVRDDGKPYILAKVPWRTDRNPSFYGVKGKEGYWHFYDLGRKGEGGTIIDFVMKYKGLGFVETLDFLTQHLEEIKKAPQSGSLSLSQKVELKNLRSPQEDEIATEWLSKIWKLERIPENLKVADLVIHREKVVHNPKGFAEVRTISKEYPDPVMVWIDENGNPIYWRTINPAKSYKGFLKSNEPRLIKGKNQNLYVVEGFTDYLALYQIDPEGNFLILGTAQNTDKVLSTLKKASDKYRIFIVLDNDPTGREATEKILKEVDAIDLSEFYKNHKDIMEWWQTQEWENFKRLKEVINPPKSPQIERDKGGFSPGF